MVPTVAEYVKPKTQVTTVKPQWTDELALEAGNLAKRMLPMMNVMDITIEPMMRGQRRPRRSTRSMQLISPTRDMMLEILLMRSERDVVKPMR